MPCRIMSIRSRGLARQAAMAGTGAAAGSGLANGSSGAYAAGTRSSALKRPNDVVHAVSAFADEIPRSEVTGGEI